MDKKFKRTLITAALPYANGPVHIGHLAGVYIPADIYARYLRLKGEEVLFVCGSDEHGVAISIKAKKDTTDYNSKDSISLSDIEKTILNRKLLKIVKQDNEFKYSCADEAYIEYRYLLLTKDSLFIVEMEPMEFAVKTTFFKDKALVVENPQKVRYKVELVDKNKEITYWKMDNGSGGVVDEYCFYAIPVDNLKKFKLKKEICRD